MDNNTETRKVYILQIREYGEDDQVFVKATKEEAEAIILPYFIDCTFNEEVKAALHAAKDLDEVQEIVMENEIGYFDLYTQDVTFKD